MAAIGIAGCGSDACISKSIPWIHRDTRVMYGCASEPVSDQVVGVFGDPEWVEQGTIWHGQAIVVEPGTDIDVTMQLCDGGREFLDKDLFPKDCAAKGGNVVDEVEVDHRSMNVAVPAFEASDVERCRNPETWWEPFTPADPGPVLSAGCARYFGVVVRLRDEAGELLSEHFRQLHAYALFPGAPVPEKLNLSLHVVSVVERPDRAIDIELRGLMPRDVADFNSEYSGTAGQYGVFPTVGTMTGEARWSSATLDGDEAVLKFSWLPDAASSGVLVVRLNVIRVVFGSTASDFTDVVVRLSREGGAWRASVAPTAEWLQ